MKHSRALLMVALLALAAAGCGGGGTSTGPTPVQPAGPTPTSVKISLTIPVVASQASGRSPADLSPQTSGLTIQVYLHSDVTHANLLYHASVDVSGASSLCTTSGTQRTCSIPFTFFPPPAGDTFDVVFIEFNTPPVLGVIPATATNLGTGTVSVSSSTTGTVNITATIAGLPATVALVPTTQAFIGDQGAKVLSMGVNVMDASGAMIIGPYASPVTVSATDTGAHALLSVNGGTTKAAVVQLSSATDATNFKIYYDGSGGANYSASIASLGGVSAKLNALTVAGTAGYLSGPPPQLPTVSNLQGTLTVVEANFAGTFSSTTTCTNAALLAPLTQSANTGQVVVTGGLTPGTCTVTFSDGTLSYPAISVLNTVPGAPPVVLPSPSASPGGIGVTPSPAPLPTASGGIGGVGASPTPLPLPT